MTKNMRSFRISKLAEMQIDELTEKLEMTQTEVITMAINSFYEKMEDRMNEKMISYEDFENWHTARGTDEIPEDLMHRAYETYQKLFQEYGKDTADEMICGHEVWDS